MNSKNDVTKHVTTFVDDENNRDLLSRNMYPCKQTCPVLLCRVGDVINKDLCFKNINDVPGSVANLFHKKDYNGAKTYAESVLPPSETFMESLENQFKFMEETHMTRSISSLSYFL